jgi:hypothetical protein
LVPDSRLRENPSSSHPPKQIAAFSNADDLMNSGIPASVRLAESSRFDDSAQLAMTSAQSAARDLRNSDTQADDDDSAVRRSPGRTVLSCAIICLCVRDPSLIC